MNPRNDDREVLRDGELTVLGRIRSASNATFLCESHARRVTPCTASTSRSPVRRRYGISPTERWPAANSRAYLVSTQLGWNIVPYTIIRHGPAGPGMLQLWVEQPGDTADSDPRPGPDLVDLFPADKPQPGYLPVLRAYDYAGDEVILMHADDIRLWRMAVFDVLINNADRKGGHVLRDLDGHIYGVDHGVCLHVENKLRTVLWGWAGKPVDEQTLKAVAGLADALSRLARRCAGRAHHPGGDRGAAQARARAAGQSGDARAEPASPHSLAGVLGRGPVVGDTEAVSPAARTKCDEMTDAALAADLAADAGELLLKVREEIGFGHPVGARRRGRQPGQRADPAAAAGRAPGRCGAQRGSLRRSGRG